MGTQLVAWNRYGKRRTYVNDADGTSLGYRDEATGEVHVAVSARADDVRRALAAPTPPAPTPPAPTPSAPAPTVATPTTPTPRVPGPPGGARPATVHPADPERVRRRRAALSA